VGEICRINRGRVISKEYLRDNAGEYPVYSSQTENNGVFGFIDSFDYDHESITWTTDGANAGSVFYHHDEKFSITNVCGLLEITNPSEVHTKYLYYSLGKEAKKYVSSGMGNPKLMSNAMSRIKVPVPSLEEQARIVSILDKFDALVNDLSIGLPAELNARRQQYEYYRDRLLTFKEAA
jgi:type I restriction enzyme S subunit